MGFLPCNGGTKEEKAVRMNGNVVIRRQDFLGEIAWYDAIGPLTGG